jgi:hypothetical protein
MGILCIQSSGASPTTRSTKRDLLDTNFEIIPLSCEPHYGIEP